MESDLYMLDCFMEGMMKTIIKYTPIAMEHPDNYEARANLMWTSSWAINGFINGGKNQAWSCHPMEHELSAIYDITHGHGLAILTCWITIRDLVFCGYPFLKSVIVLSNSLFFFSPKILYKAFLLVF